MQFPGSELEAASGPAAAASRTHAATPQGEVSPWRVQHLGFREPGRTEIFYYDEEELPDGCFRVRTRYSGISTGTELTHFIGTNPYLQARWDEELKLFADGDGRTEYPVPFSGYMQVGRVEASRVRSVREGEWVCMAYGHKTGHTARAASELFFPLPPDLDPILGIYVAQMGPICMNGVLHADEEAFGEAAQEFGVGVRGRTVLVCGTGIIGLLTGMLCRWAGASEVAIAGRNPWKLSVAETLGMTPLNTGAVDVGRWCKERWHDGLGARGAEVAFQCTGSDEMLHLAFRALQPQSAVIDLGFYQDGASQVLLGREFHHNGLKHTCAQIGRVPRKLASCWTRRRLAAEMLAFLRFEGEAIRERLITHRLPFHRAQEAFDLLATDGRHALQVVLECS